VTACRQPGGHPMFLKVGLPRWALLIGCWPFVHRQIVRVHRGETSESSTAAANRGEPHSGGLNRVGVNLAVFLLCFPV
jgi:hypothetical protein